ncbi:MAG: 50S ribosomal protein L4 [Candidatus Aenigmarchaeota archaeon]|nr:50S ribosomal protein L4 [Candidatus Aenigmarchaeota archaeon]
MYNVFTIKGEKKTIDKIPRQFSEPVRFDLIKRAFYTIEGNDRQPYGTNIRAGFHSSAENRGRRRGYGCWINKGMHRTKRIRIGSGGLAGTVRIVPHSVKGRKAHPPKAEKIWSKKLNNTERKKAIRSAIAGTGEIKYILQRDHIIDEKTKMPLIVESLNDIKKTKELNDFLNNIGLEKEIQRAKIKKIRAGRGTMRGRKYKTKTGPLLIYGDEEVNEKTLSSLQGIESVNVRGLNAKLLSPGAHSIRLCIWTQNAMNLLEEEELFY